MHRGINSLILLTFCVLALAIFGSVSPAASAVCNQEWFDTWGVIGSQTPTWTWAASVQWCADRYGCYFDQCFVAQEMCFRTCGGDTNKPPYHSCTTCFYCCDEGSDCEYITLSSTMLYKGMKAMGFLCESKGDKFVKSQTF